jgi:hypothetical protein
VPAFHAELNQQWQQLLQEVRNAAQAGLVWVRLLAAGLASANWPRALQIWRPCDIL